MKKVLIIITISLLSFAAFAQDGKSIYNKYSDAENVSAVYISSSMFRIIGKLPDIDINDEDVNLSSVVKSLAGLYIISSENERINSNLMKDAEKMVKSGSYEILMEAKDNGEIVHIYTSGKGDEIDKFVLIASEQNECTFICLDGKISRSDLEKIIGQN